MDTVIIKIYGPHKFKIRNKSWFVPELTKREYHELSPTEMQSVRPYLRRFVFKPTYQSEYLPRVEIFETLTNDKKGVRYILKLEFSVPKLLYGNSLQEVVEEDRGRIVACLQSSLASVGIVVDTKTIAGARLSAVHLCKNILLPPDIRMQEVVKELMRVDINKAVDVTTKEHKHGARVLHIYSGTVERVFYDKVSDALRPKNKRKDKAHIERERALIERCGLQSREMFRYEYRIKKTQTVMREINRALEREDLKAYVSFSDVFTKGLFKKVLLASWRILIEEPQNQLALIGTTDNLTLFLHILSEAKEQGGGPHTMNNSLISYGLTRVIRDHGAKEVHSAIFSVWSTDHPERLTKKVKAAAKLTRGLPPSNNIALIDGMLESFEPVALEALENGV